jgi:hypothetical protein
MNEEAEDVEDVEVCPYCANDREIIVLLLR